MVNIYVARAATRIEVQAPFRNPTMPHRCGACIANMPQGWPCRTLCVAFGFAAVLAASWKQQNVFKREQLVPPDFVAVSSTLDLAAVLES